MISLPNKARALADKLEASQSSLDCLRESIPVVDDMLRQMRSENRETKRQILDAQNRGHYDVLRAAQNLAQYQESCRRDLAVMRDNMLADIERQTPTSETDTLRTNLFKRLRRWK